jgi:KDO2-lipid IV(A) lauroyltransferase
MPESIDPLISALENPLPRPEEPRDDPWPVPWEEVAGRRGGALAWIEYVLLRGSLVAFSHLPRAGRDALAHGLAGMARRFARDRSRIARSFIEQAFGAGMDPARREALVLAAWQHLFTLTLEDARFNSVVLGPRMLDHFEVEMCEPVRRLLAERRGGICITAHVGHWEALPAIGNRLGFAPVYVVSRPPQNRPLSRYAQRLREARGYRLLHRHGAVQSITRIVAARGFVGLMLDQRAHGKTLLAPFFGRHARCERSVAVLLRRLRAPVFSGACYRTEEPFRYRVVFPRLFEPVELERLSPEEIATLVNRELEQLILRHPEQYFWLHDRYRKAPPAEEAPDEAAGRARVER